MDYHALNPFVLGRRYRARRDFASFDEAFKEGEVLTFVDEAFSGYDGQRYYYFEDATGKGRTFTHDIYQQPRAEILRERFEEVAEGPDR